VLLDVGGGLLIVGLALAGFLVVLIVSVLVLRLIGVVLGDSGAETSGSEGGADPEP